MNNIMNCFDDSDIERFWKSVDKQDDNKCWDWKGCIKKDKGYGQMSFCKNGRQYVSETHRISMIICNTPQPENKKLVCHTCNNKKCCNPSHLYWGDKYDNSMDMMKDGTARGQFEKGRPSNNRKITIEQAQQIKEDIKTMTCKKASEKNNVSIHIVRDISRSKTWKNI